MKLKIPDLILMIALVVGGVLAWRTARERSRLEAEHDRLAQATGDLRIGDPTKVHILALETGEPLHFAWRIYTPPNCNLRIATNSGFSGSTGSSGPNEFIARVRFREDDEGILNSYRHFGGASSRGAIGDKALAELLHGRWEKLRVVQLGSSELFTVAPEAPATLLRLTLPEDIQAEALKKLPLIEQERYFPVLFELKLEPNPTKPPSSLPGK